MPLLNQCSKKQNAAGRATPTGRTATNHSTIHQSNPLAGPLGTSQVVSDHSGQARTGRDAIANCLASRLQNNVHKQRQDFLPTPGLTPNNLIIKNLHKDALHTLNYPYFPFPHTLRLTSTSRMNSVESSPPHHDEASPIGSSPPLKGTRHAKNKPPTIRFDRETPPIHPRVFSSPRPPCSRVWPATPLAAETLRGAKWAKHQLSAGTETNGRLALHDKAESHRQA